MWRAEFGLTFPWNVPLPLAITQQGHPDLDFTARFASRPFESPVTWLIRIGRWNDGRAWEVALLHHKLHLENGPPEVQSFSISHGYNVLTLQRAWRPELWEWRAGAGLVIAHVENTVRGARWEETGGTFGGGYHAGGPAVSGAVARPVELGRWAAINLEAGMSASWMSVPVMNGRARGFNVFVQLAVLLGIER